MLVSGRVSGHVDPNLDSIHIQFRGYIETYFWVSQSDSTCCFFACVFLPTLKQTPSKCPPKKATGPKDLHVLRRIPAPSSRGAVLKP